MTLHGKSLEVGARVVLTGTVERVAFDGEYAVQIYGDLGGAKRFSGSALNATEHPGALQDILSRQIEEDALFRLLKDGKATPADQEFAAEWLSKLRSQLIEAMTARMR
jgi:hypothetical protein